MLVINQYIRVQSLQEAYDLCQDRNNIIIGGMLWLKMQNRNVNVAIDLSDLGLDTIEETEEEFRIGAMVSLRQLELHKGLNQYTNNAIKHSVEHIVGVQFRNLATVGGSVFGKYGFSDVLTMLMSLDAYVELHHGGIIPIVEFANMPITKDVLVRIIIKKTPIKVVYLSQRNTKTDFPVITTALSYFNDNYHCVVGARPLKAALVSDENNILSNNYSQDEIETYANYVVEQLSFGSNLRGSSTYRQLITKVLIKRGLKQLQGGNACGN